MLLPFCTGRQWMEEDGKTKMTLYTKRPKTSQHGGTYINKSLFEKKAWRGLWVDKLAMWRKSFL